MSPRRRCVGWTVTPATPAMGSQPPGTRIRKVWTLMVPTIRPESYAASDRSNSTGVFSNCDSGMPYPKPLNLARIQAG